MIAYLPCKIGEEFYPMEFVDWIDGKRVYKRSKYTKVLKAVDVYFCNTECLNVPIMITDTGFFSYYPGYLEQFEPKYTIDVRQRFHEKKTRDGSVKMVEEKFLQIRELKDEEYTLISPELLEEDNGQLVFEF